VGPIDFANDISVWHSYPSRGIVYDDRRSIADEALAEIPLPLKRGRHARQRGIAARNVTGAFVVEEEKGLIVPVV
jgi:hypothetical protein